MKTNLKASATLLLFLLIVSCSKREKRETKFPDGKPQEVFDVVETKDGSFIKDGEYKSWYPGGQQMIDGHYSNGKKDGQWKHWFQNGQMESDIGYKNDTLDGSFVKWFENGQKSLEVRKSMNKNVGRLTAWHDNGKMNARGNFNEEGKPDSVHIFWNANGNKISEETYSNGLLNGSVRYWGIDGKLVCSREFKDGEDINLPATYRNGKGDRLELMKGGKYKFTYARTDFSHPQSTGDFQVSKGNTIEFSGIRHAWPLKKFTKDTLIKSGNYFVNEELFIRLK